ncbi:MAG: hypothetical protein AB4372_21415 [Xenococcus sp. (in: cyanobacteria)]
MADERRRVTTDSFNPVTLELIQNYALICSQNEGEFVRNMVQHHVVNADRDGILDKSLAQLAAYIGKDLEEFKIWIRQLRDNGMSNSQIMNRIEEDKRAMGDNE